MLKKLIINSKKGLIIQEITIDQARNQPQWEICCFRLFFSNWFPIYPCSTPTTFDSCWEVYLWHPDSDILFTRQSGLSQKICIWCRHSVRSKVVWSSLSLRRQTERRGNHNILRVFHGTLSVEIRPSEYKDGYLNFATLFLASWLLSVGGLTEEKGPSLPEKKLKYMY